MAHPKYSLEVTILCFMMGLILAAHSHPTHPKTSNNDFVAVHNAVRAAVGVGPITWSEKVAAYARNYANRRAATGCDMEHSGGPYGENLAEGYGEMSGAEAVRFWATEKANYNYSSNSCVGDECLHYTQIVWRNSVRLGCARAKCHNGWMFVICNYDPPGNYEGQRPY